jgi:site-specific DNA-methyltransferase (adenine-specific)
MDTKKRVETYHSASGTARTGVRAGPAPQGTHAAGASEKLIVNPTTTVLRGDVADMMQRHVADGAIDLITVDPPYLMQTPKQRNAIDYYNSLYGMSPTFREDWDQFPDIATYEAFSQRWIIEAMRCLNKQGSLFIFCSHFCVGPIARMLQMMRINVVQHIQVVKLNGRPIIKPRVLQYSHYTIIWASNDGKEYQFNGYRCKQAHWSNDPFNAERGRMMRDVWLIPNSGHENKTQFPAQKMVAVFDRILTMCGKPGGTMMDVFAGSGTGAVAALRWGMQSISIEREPKYVGDIIKRIQAERPPK